MSGIAGIFNLDGRPADRDLLARMTEIIAHRGPDGSGQWIDGAVGLGHQMLCTTPESLREQQPWRDATGRLCLVLDGRVDNRAELQAALSLAGMTLRNDTDAELVLQAYACWGEDCARRIIGDFAFAIWDGARQQLFCARDFLGIKPFYYHLGEHGLRFGSELRQILEDKAIPRRPNQGMVGEYLAGAITSQEETLYQGIMRLPPAHLLIVGAGWAHRRRYWQPDFSNNIRYKTDEEYADAFLAIFKEAVRCRLRSVGTVGVSLSGGLDSSSIACVAQALLREAGAAAPGLVALSEVFPGQECDESAYIQDVVQKWGIESYQVQRAGADPTLFAKQARRYLDFPGYPNGGVADPVSMLARERGLRVLLDGLGGDEWLTGTADYYANMISHLELGPLVQQLRADIKDIGMRATAGQLLWHGLNPLFPQRARDAVKWALRRKPDIPTWVDAGFARRAGLAERTRSRSPYWSFSQPARANIWRSAANGVNALAYEIEERAAAWLGFEPRHPFHDRRLVEFALALPEEQRCQQGWIKSILRMSMEDYLPESIWKRWDKAEFSHLFGNMLLEPAIDQLLDQLAIASLGWVDRQAVREMYQRMAQLFRQGDDQYMQYIWKLWRIAGVELWFTTTFLNGDALAGVEPHFERFDREPALVVV